MKQRRKRKGFIEWFKELSMWKKAVLCFLVLVLCLLTGLVIYVASKFNKIQTEEIPEDEIIVNEIENLDEIFGDGYTNVVLFGSDSRTGEVEQSLNTDAIIIASLNNETKEVKLVSIYRDTLLDVDEEYYTKCNAAYSLGGAKQAINMLNKNLDLDIKKYVTVNFQALSDVVDLLGGIEVDVSEAEMNATNKYIKETATVAGKEVTYIKEPGYQTLNGVQATTYARIRKGVGDDYKRTERQRLVIEKIAGKVLQSDLVTINKIIDKVFPSISTNFTLTEILSYAKSFAKFKIDDSAGFPFDRGSSTIAGRGSCVYALDLKSNVSQLHEFLFGTIDYEPSEMVCTISQGLDYLIAPSQGSYTQSWEPEVQEPKPSQPEVTEPEPSQPEVQEPTTPEVQEPTTPEVSEPSQPETPETTEPEPSQPTTPEVTDPEVPDEGTTDTVPEVDTTTPEAGTVSGDTAEGAATGQ